MEESSSMTSQREETKTSQVRTEEIEEVIATPIFETKDFLTGGEEWGATVYDVSTQTEPKCFADQSSQTGTTTCVEQQNGTKKVKQQNNKVAKSSKELKESTNLKSDDFECRNLKIKIPDAKLKTLKSKPLSAPCAATEEKTTKKSTQNKENVVKSKCSSRERLTSKILRDEDQSKSSFSPFNRSFSSPGCMNTLSLADEVDCDVIGVCDKLPPLNPATSRRSSLSRSEAQMGTNEKGEMSERTTDSPTSAFERNIGVEIPSEFKRSHHHQRAKVDSRRPPLSTASVAEHKSPQRRMSRYKEMQMRNSPSPEVQASILHHQPNDEVIIRKSGKAKRYRVKDHYQEPVPRCASPAQDPRRFRSRAQGREVPVEVQGPRQQDFVDGTNLRRGSARRSSANLEERKDDRRAVNPGYPQNRDVFHQRRQDGASRPRSVTGNWKPQSYSPVMGETPSTIKTKDKVYKPREVYETDDYTFVICPKGSSRR